MDTLPILHPEEKAWIEECVGRPVSEEEAQILFHQARLAPGPYEEWLLNRKGAA